MGGVVTAGSYRMVATDLDGTIVRSDGTISARTRAALGTAEAAGAVVVIVTGRPPRWLAGIADATGHHGLAICANGALLYDLRAEQVIGAAPVVRRARCAIWSSAARRDPRHRVRGRAGGRRVPARAGVPARGGTPTSAAVDDRRSRRCSRRRSRSCWPVTGRTSADDLLALARTAVGDESVATLTHSSADGLLEISAAGVSKATTLADYAAEHGIGRRSVIAFGDMPNDLPMLEWAGHSVAVANAHPEVLAVADEVTASNDDDGVAQVLERVFG